MVVIEKSAVGWVELSKTRQKAVELIWFCYKLTAVFLIKAYNISIIKEEGYMLWEKQLKGNWMQRAADLQ